LTLSIGFYGIKGGLFTIASGGSYRVWGPEGSFIEDNNHLALATIMAVPLLRYLQLQAANVWARRGYLAALFLCTISALGSHSRGALLAVAAMGFFLWLKTRNKVVVGLIVLAIIPLVLAVAPENWTERMQSIKTYDQDASAMGRINAWWVAWNLAVDRFPIGGGFGMWEADVFAKYAPDPADIHVAHSIYFQVLGEQGFMGLFLFLLIFTIAWFHANRVLRMARGRSDLLWARDLASMAQVSLIGS
jgi:probable O-glycosylation ligase (exosortase A-associated)